MPRSPHSKSHASETTRSLRAPWACASFAAVFAMAAAGHAQQSVPREPTATLPVRLAPLAGHYQTLSPLQAGIGFWGTDQGWTFKDGNRLRILFGDSWSDTFGNSIGPLGPSDDTQGWIDLNVFPTGASVEAWVGTHHYADFPWHAAGPTITYRVNGLGKVTPMFVYDGGWDPNHLMTFGLGATPGTGFSNGPNVFGLFGRGEIVTCSDTKPCDSHNYFSCDHNLGICANTSGAATKPCFKSDGGAGCDAGVSCVSPFPTQNGGVCIDPTTFPKQDKPAESLSLVTMNHIGNSDPNVPENYYTQPWLTNKFTNITTRTVRKFSANGVDYGPIAAQPTADEKVFLWGRPLFIGEYSQQRDLPLYFAYADMPVYSATGAFTWHVHYYKGGPGTDFVNSYTDDPTKAVPLNLNGHADGLQNDEDERWDVDNQLSISYVPNMNKWVMLYGGDIHPNIISFFEFVNTAAVPDTTHSIHVRIAENPWGPWSKPSQFFSPGNPGLPSNPNAPPNPAAPITGEYAPLGMMHDSNCIGIGCVVGELALSYVSTNYGFLYAPNIIDVWTTPTPNSSTDADLYWNVSTWDPYETVLMKTHIHSN